MSKFGKVLAKYLETPASSAGESPWLADYGREVGGMQAVIAFGFIQLWLLLAGVHYSFVDGPYVGALVLLVLFAACNIKWRRTGLLSSFGSIVGGAISALLLVNIMRNYDGSTLDLFTIMIGWVASGVLNVRFSYWFWGNPSVGYGTGAFTSFISGPLYFLLWSLFFIVAIPLELLLNGFDALKKKRK